MNALAVAILAVLVASVAPSKGPKIPPLSLTKEFYARQSCMRDLFVPEHLQALFAFDIFPDEECTWCFTRCLGIRSGHYTEAGGFDIKALYNDLKTALDFDYETFRFLMELCIAVNERPYRNDCERAYLTFFKCRNVVFEELSNELDCKT